MVVGRLEQPTYVVRPKLYIPTFLSSVDQQRDIAKDPSSMAVQTTNTHSHVTGLGPSIFF